MYWHPLSQPLSYKRFEFDEYLSMFIFGDIGYAVMNDVDYSVYWQLFHRDLTFLPTKRKINGVTKLVCTYFDNRK